MPRILNISELADEGLDTDLHTVKEESVIQRTHWSQKENKERKTCQGGAGLKALCLSRG